LQPGIAETHGPKATAGDNPGPGAPNPCLEIFRAFLKIGSLMVGGGNAALPLIYAEVVERRCWLDRDTFMAGTALSQAAPGANAVNLAVFVGYRLAGLAGAAAAVIACILPAVSIIVLLGLVLFQFLEHPVVAHIFGGLRAGIIGLLIFYALEWARPLLRDPKSLTLAALALVALLLLKWNPIAVIVAGGLCGYLLLSGGGNWRRKG